MMSLYNMFGGLEVFTKSDEFARILSVNISETELTITRIIFGIMSIIFIILGPILINKFPSKLNNMWLIMYYLGVFLMVLTIGITLIQTITFDNVNIVASDYERALGSQKTAMEAVQTATNELESSKNDNGTLENNNKIGTIKAELDASNAQTALDNATGNKTAKETAKNTADTNKTNADEALTANLSTENANAVISIGQAQIIATNEFNTSIATVERLTTAKNTADVALTTANTRKNLAEATLLVVNKQLEEANMKVENSVKPEETAKTDGKFNQIGTIGKLILRNLVIPFIVISSLILMKIPRDIKGDYFKYMVNNLHQLHGNGTQFLIQVGIFSIPVVYGFSEILSNLEEDYMFKNVESYYTFIGGICSMIFMSIMKLVGGISISISEVFGNKFKFIPETNKPNILAQSLVIFTTIFAILSNLGQRSNGLLIASSLQFLTVIGGLLISGKLMSNIVWIVIMVVLLLSQIFVFTVPEIAKPIEEGTKGLLNLDTLIYGLITILGGVIYSNIK